MLLYVLEMRDVEQEETDSIRNSNETETAGATKSSITQSAWKPIYNGTGTEKDWPNV